MWAILGPLAAATLPHYPTRPGSLLALAAHLASAFVLGCACPFVSASEVVSTLDFAFALAKVDAISSIYAFAFEVAFALAFALAPGLAFAAAFSPALALDVDPVLIA